MDFLLIIINFFRFGATSEYRLEVGISEGAGLVWPKFSGRGGRPPPTILRVAELDASTFRRI